MNSKKYKDNDYELLYLISENNDEAKDLFYKKYKPIIEMKIKKYINYVQARGYDENDLIQEGMIGLSRALTDFKTQKDVQFNTFANVCIDRQIFSFLRDIDSGKHKVLNDSLSYDTTTNTYGRGLNDLLDNKNKNPETTFVEEEESNDLFDNILSVLTDKEKDVFKLRSQGFTCKEIAALLNTTEKAVSHAIEKIKIKAKKVLDER